MQEVFWPENVWSPQANFRLESELKDGDTVKRIIPSKMVPTDYTRYSDITFQQGTTAAESLVVDKTPTIPFIISDLDELQSTPKARSKFTEMSMTQLNNIINGWFTAEVTNATSTIDAADFGGTAGNGAVITTSNITKMFALAQKKVGRMNVFKYGAGKSPFSANLTPDVYQVLLEYLAGKESILGDKTGENGHAGQFFGFDLYVHNGGYWTGSLTLVTQPTTADTVTIKVHDRTIVFNLVTTIGTTAGNVLVVTNNDTTGANLAALINAPGTTTANGVALSTDDQAALYGCTATYTAGTDLLTLTWRGVGAPVVSVSMTSANNFWTPGKNISNLMFTKKGAVDMVLQKYPTIEIDKAESRIGEWKIKPYTLFGKKTFSDGAKKIVNIKVDTTSYT